MTNHETSSTPRKRLLLYFILTSAALVIAWITYFLLSFDLNNYRQQTEEQLSALLSLPVKIGEVHYNLNETNLALHIANLEIANDDSPVQVKSPGIMINLKWRGLFERDFKFAKIVLSQPEIWVRPYFNEQFTDDTPLVIPKLSEIGPDLLHKVSVDRLEIVDGTVYIESSRPDQSTQQVEITELNGEISDLRLGRAIQLSLRGDLSIPGQLKKSSWTLHGESSLELGRDNVLEPHINLDLKLKELDLNTIKSSYAEHLVDFSINGSVDLDLHIDTDEDRNIFFQSELSSKDFELRPTPDYTRPIIFKKLLASGELQLQGERPGISNLTLQIDQSRMTGQIDWTTQEKPTQANFTLLNSHLPLLQLRRWFPNNQEAWLTIQQNLSDQGVLYIDRATFTLFGDNSSQQKWKVDSFKGDLRQVMWKDAKIPAVEIISLPLELVDKSWQITTGRIQWGHLPLDVNGTGEYKKGEIILTSLDFTGEVSPKIFLKEWELTQHSLVTNGAIKLSGNLAGPLDKLSLDIQADLSQFNLSHPDKWRLTPQPDDRLTLHATLSPERISLDHGAITWSLLKGHISGGYHTENHEDLTVVAFLKIDDLSKLANILPSFEALQLHGQADLSINQKGWPEKNSPEMTLTLRDAGLRTTDLIADLSQINGRAQLTSTGLVAHNLQVHLGDSPLVVQAEIEDFSKPRLLLDVRAPSIHADDLVFYSAQSILRNVEGHLEIDKDGLTFAPVDVSLDGGTKASVRGTISFHAPFDVKLDVTSEFARISEVIALWADRSEKSKKRSASIRDKKNVKGTETRIEINASVKKGDLYGMSFHDATGIIVPTHDRLTIHPLDFSVGEGFCNAQVLNDFSDDGPTLLRISGHAQDVDAQEVYQELLNQKNIVHGKLRGDFYLNGEIGSNYLPSSYGHFNIQVHDGVLRKFQVLSKVFSLLNVSQIFALKLPDMDQEGMPFDLLSANFHLEKGILSSGDLEIRSEAMNQSYIGQFNLIDKEIDLTLALHPLGTVDKIVSRIPLAGWLLTGEDKALLTAYFSVKGNAGDASVIPLPLGTITEPTFGLLKRTLRLPFKLFENPEILWGGEGQKE